MSIVKEIVIVSFLIISVLLIYPAHSISAQTLNANANTTIPDSQTLWKIYTNSKFGFSVEYPQSWIISEKQNRFESGVEATIESPNVGGPNHGSFNFIDAPPSTTSNIRVLTNLGVKEIVGSFDVDYDKRLIESANVTKYVINGERAGAFTYVLDSKEFTDGDTMTTPVVAAEVVTTIHDGKAYIFQFMASPENFDNPTLTDIRQHMFNSTKWLN